MQKRVVEPQADETRTESKVERAEPSRGAPDAESKKEQLDRLHSMASGDETWDLSPNDLTALRNLLDGYVVLLEALKLARTEMMGLAAYLETCDWEVISTNLPSLVKSLNYKVSKVEAAIKQAERT